MRTGGTQPGTGRAGHGDFYLRVHVQVPERLSAEEREQYERLRALEKKGRRRHS